MKAKKSKQTTTNEQNSARVNALAGSATRMVQSMRSFQCFTKGRHWPFTTGPEDVGEQAGLAFDNSIATVRVRFPMDVTPTDALIALREIEDFIQSNRWEPNRERDIPGTGHGVGKEEAAAALRLAAIKLEREAKADDTNDEDIPF
jgi:hypothetical protein